MALAVAIVAQARRRRGGDLVGGRRAARSPESALPADARWVDHAGLGSVTLVGRPATMPAPAIEQLLWNTFDRRASTLLPGATRVDRTPTSRCTCRRRHARLAGGPVDGPVLVDRVGTWMSFADARLVRTTMGSERRRVRPLGADRLACAPHRRSGRAPIGQLADAHGVDHRLAGRDRHGDSRSASAFRIPRAATDTIHFTGAANASFTVHPMQTRTISFLIPAGSRPWTVRWCSDRYGYRNGAAVSFLSAPPRITATAGPLR